MTLTSQQIHWLAGILEGEGSFGYHGTTPCIQIQMSDRDIIERIAELFGVKPQSPWQPKPPGSKLIFTCKAHGRRALGWMMTLYSLMGERRQEQIRKALERWKAQPRTTHASRGKRTPAQCHPDKHVTAWGLCKPCYMREYRRRAEVA